MLIMGTDSTKQQIFINSSIFGTKMIFFLFNEKPVYLPLLGIV